METRQKLRKAVVTRKREVRIHAELWHTADTLLRTGQAQKEGSAHQFRASLIFRAFYIEAFLNWLGPELIPHWRYLERLKPKEKLELLSDLVQVKPDYSSRPWQIVGELFSFRNSLAHGRPRLLEQESEEDLQEALEGPITFVPTEWERFADERNAVRAKQDVEKIATLLYEKAEVKHEGPLGPFSFGFQVRHAHF